MDFKLKTLLYTDETVYDTTFDIQNNVIRFGVNSAKLMVFFAGFIGFQTGQNHFCRNQFSIRLVYGHSVLYCAAVVHYYTYPCTR